MKSKIFSFINKNKIKISIGIGLFLFMVLPIFNRRSLLTMITNNNINTGYTEEVKSITINSAGYANSEPGSIQIIKSAEWVDIDKAKISFELRSNHKYKSDLYDIVFIVDTSNSMNNGRLDQLKSDSSRLIDYLLEVNSNNRMALITYNSTSKIELGFTNDGSLMKEKINSLRAYFNTNYYLPFLDLEKLLENYQKENGRDLVVLFLTDGFPNEQTPQEVEVYKRLKEKYPYMTVNGVQYELGLEIRKEIKDVSDRQFVATRRDLLDVLKSATIPTAVYDELFFKDYINTDYFEFDSIPEYATIDENKYINHVDKGEGQTVYINGINSFSGFVYRGEFIVKLKDEYIREPGFYPTNKKETIDFKIDDISENILSNDTPVLEKRAHTVYHDPNTPEGCSIPSTSEKFVTFDKVTIRTDTLECDGYIFKGWNIYEEVTKVNDETFIMPDKDVHVIGSWAKQSVNKKMDGTVKEKLTLFKEFTKDYNANNNVALYTGQATDTYDNSANGPIYYYYGLAEDNNVIFGGFCWKMVRTTQTGGVKLLYNGTPDEGKCNKTGQDTTIGFSEYNGYYNQYTFESNGYMYNKIYYWNSASGSLNQVSGALYGSDVTYDSRTDKYTLIDPQTTLDSTHHYSCNSTSSTCYTQVRFFFNADTKYFIFMNYGATIETMIHDTFFADDVNTTSSAVKKKVDNWYRSNLTSYTDKLEDTVFCNDRSIYSYGGFAKDGDNSWRSPNIKFNVNNRMTTGPSLYCENVTDRFSVGNTKAKLTYPVAIPSYDEVALARNLEQTNSYTYIGDSYISKDSKHYLIMSYSSYGSSMYGLYVDGGFINTFGNGQGAYVRPMVSLKKDTVYNYGDGTKDNPFVIEG